MYDNIGEKIKGLAKHGAITCIVLGLIVTIIGFSMYIQNKDYLEYATINGGSSSYTFLEKSGNDAYSGMQLMTYGLSAAFLSAILSWPLYGIGELVENSNKIARNSRNILEKMQNEE